MARIPVNKYKNQAGYLVFNTDTNEVEVFSDGTFKSAVNKVFSGLPEDSVNVKDFGAKGDGITDDTIAIQNAINAGKAGIYFPSGTYITSSPLMIPSGTKIIGASQKSTIISNTSSDVFELTGNEGIVFKSLSIIGNERQNIAINCENIVALESMILEDLYIDNFFIGYKGSQNDRFIPIYNCRFWNNKYGIYIVNNHPRIYASEFRYNEYGIYGMVMFDIELLYNKLSYNDYGIYSETNSRNVLIAGNMFYRNNIQGLNIGQPLPEDSYNLDNSLITGNIFRGSPGQIGIVVNGNVLNIVGNLFTYVSHPGFDYCIKVTDVPKSYVNISDNIIQGNYGIYIETDFKDSSISNNIITSNNPIKITSAVSDTTNLKINNNTIGISNPTENALIQIDKPSAPDQRLMIANNTLTSSKSSAYAIEIYGDYTMIINNISQGTLGLNNLSVTSDNAIIKDNMFN